MQKNDLQEVYFCADESTCPTLMERCGACLFLWMLRQIANGCSVRMKRWHP